MLLLGILELKLTSGEEVDAIIEQMPYVIIDLVDCSITATFLYYLIVLNMLELAEYGEQDLHDLEFWIDRCVVLNKH